MNDFFTEINRTLDRFLTPAVKKILVINVVVTLATAILSAFKPGFLNSVVNLLGQRPAVSYRFVWQFVTYMFVHVDPWHLAVNMLMLWFFAPALEQRWGTRAFWSFYLTSGIGAGVIHALVSRGMWIADPSYITQMQMFIPVIGASGAIYGVMLAYAAYWPDRVVLVYFVAPVKIKYLMIVSVLITFMSSAPGHGGDISHLTHLTGLGVAYAWLALRHKDWDIRRWRWR